MSDASQHSNRVGFEAFDPGFQPLHDQLADKGFLVTWARSVLGKKIRREGTIER